MPTDPTRHVEPLDPRRVKCPRCNGDGREDSHGHASSTCWDCQGTTRVPLRPEPTVEVWFVRDHETGAEGWSASLGDGPVGGLEETKPDALQAVRLLYLRARLIEPDDWGWRVDFGIGKHGGFATGRTQEEAIENAFQTLDGVPK